jgi:hypothetical protein
MDGSASQIGEKFFGTFEATPKPEYLLVEAQRRTKVGDIQFGNDGRGSGHGGSNGVLEAINGNVQAAKRKAKGYRTKGNLKTIVCLIAGDVLANSTASS